MVALRGLKGLLLRRSTPRHRLLRWIVRQAAPPRGGRAAAPLGREDPSTGVVGFAHLAFFCKLTSLLACSRDENDESKVKIRILVFLQSKKTAVAALAKLLSPLHIFLSSSWQRCEGGLYGVKIILKLELWCYFVLNWN
jgi:hypothetical protein